MKSFMERAVAGEIPVEDFDTAILDAVDAWHEYQPTIPDDLVGENIMTWLGMSWSEYARWVEHPKELKWIVEDRKPKIGMTINHNDAVTFEKGAAISIEEMSGPAFVCSGKIAKGEQDSCPQSKTALRISVMSSGNTYTRVYYCENCMKSIISQMRRIQ